MADRLASGKKIFKTPGTEEDKIIWEQGTKEREEEREKKIQKEIDDAKVKKDELIKKVTEFNKEVNTISKEVQNLKLPGNKVLVRLYKHNPYSHGLYAPIMIKVQSRNDSGRAYMEEAALQVAPRGVICAMSDKCSEGFREHFKAGDVVDVVNGIGAEDYMCLLDKTDVTNLTLESFEGYFLFNETHIEKGFKDNLGIEVTLEK